jgi:hypothetical protein
MSRLRKEFDVFFGCPHSMQVLMVSNMIYGLVLPVIEVFVAAYVMRNSHAVAKVVTYQLSIYAATPLAFYINGKLLGRVGAKHLYAAGMVLSGVAMMLMMQLSILTPIGVATSGFTMGLATGIFWANRGFLALTATNDANRNYYYGVENFVAVLDFTAGWAGLPIALTASSPRWSSASPFLPPRSWNAAPSAIRNTPASSSSGFIPSGIGCSNWLCSRGWRRDTSLPRQPCSS